MCGIAAFLSRSVRAARRGDGVALGALVQALEGIALCDPAHPPACEPMIERLQERFADLMSFVVQERLRSEPAWRDRLEAAARQLETLQGALAMGDPRADRVRERARDYAWQIRRETLDNLDRSLALAPQELAIAADDSDAGASRRFAAWSVQQALENLDRLEVRGRDSAGIAIQLALAKAAPVDAWRAEARAAGRLGGDGDGSVAFHRSEAGVWHMRFIYKVAQLIGSLGDNGASLRDKLHADVLFWQAAGQADRLCVLVHTRWASHGAINLANCHPQNAGFLDDNVEELTADADVIGVLNGDVDNYRALCMTLAEGRGRRIDPRVTTDAKIIPVACRLAFAPDRAGRALEAARSLEGSVALALVYPDDAATLYLAQKGSGQSLFIAETLDGIVVSSENYGLAARARASMPLAKIDQGGVAVTACMDGDVPRLQARAMADGQPAALPAEPMDIFSRDIFRGRFRYFFEKEVHEAPDSVRKTLAGRYRGLARGVSFELGPDGLWDGLRRRALDPQRAKLRRIFVTGQGTAAVAGMGVALLLRQALASAGITAEAVKASELSAALDEQSLDDTLVIAISQSGTTTDTNRAADLARQAGAWIHAIVNRRNSPLVRKSDSHFFTSDGRDIEMAVASTKAFYAQVAAGKLTALCLADALGAMPQDRIRAEILALESLPARIQAALDSEADIAACAEAYAPFNRHWAVVGNGGNKIAAEEIRIKLSELCYKSIPVDYTEDKKHIDLSTEPLTLVIANDLPPALAQDTAKETAIFRAHAGKPIVIAAEGETCFDPYAERILRAPAVGAGLDFVIATVIGHLWGFHAARAIDRRSGGLRALALQAEGLALDPQAPLDALNTGLRAELGKIAAGEQDAALPARIAAQLAELITQLQAGPQDGERAKLLQRAQALLQTMFEETSRPIDTIRHQAKTVTVGISRAPRALASSIISAFAAMGLPLERVSDADRRALIAITPLLSHVQGGIAYALTGEADSDGTPVLKAGARMGGALGKASGYDAGLAAQGSKRRAVRLGRLVFASGAHERENLLLIPWHEGGDWRLAGIVLLHAAFVSQASLQQKLAVLQDLRLHDDLFDAYHEVVHGAARDFSAFLARISPRDLLFTLPRDLVAAHG
jgi:glutamine---fructose-6-phosphate transaminase (isomerizing)